MIQANCSKCSCHTAGNLRQGAVWLHRLQRYGYMWYAYIHFDNFKVRWSSMLTHNAAQAYRTTAVASPCIQILAYISAGPVHRLSEQAQLALQYLFRVPELSMYSSIFLSLLPLQCSDASSCAAGHLLQCSIALPCFTHQRLHTGVVTLCTRLQRAVCT
jgi:hypothetical protein